MQRLRGAPLDPDRLVAHADVLYRAAWALSGSRHDAEDLVQETSRLLHDLVPSGQRSGVRLLQADA